MTDAPTAPTGHSRFGFSGAERWLACPASVTAQAGMPDRSSSYAERGTLLHDAAARALLRQEDAADVLPEDEDGQDIIQDYLDTVRAARERLDGQGTTLLVERRFHLRDLHAELWGTADAVIVAPAHRTVWVGDLKTGAGKPVRPTRDDGTINLQLGGYALGALQAVKPGSVIERVEVCVIQPQNGGVMTTCVDLADMADLAANLQDGVERALLPSPEYAPGAHCEWCKAAATCSAFRDAALVSAQADFSVDPPLVRDAHSLAPDEIRAALERADLMEAWIATVREAAFGALQRGEPVPGFKLVAKRGRRKWNDEEAAAQAFADAGLDGGDIYAVKLLSPAQIEKVAKRAKVKVDVAGFTETVSSGVTMAPDDDPRPAVAAGPEADFTPQPEEV